MRAGVVIPVGPGREENLDLVLDSVLGASTLPEAIVIVADGEAAVPDSGLVDKHSSRCEQLGITWELIEAPKHQPGLEQPRNIGVRKLQEINRHNGMLRMGYPMTHVWFLDSDCIVTVHTLGAYGEAESVVDKYKGKRILIGPYDWLAQDFREVPPLTGNENPGAGQFETIDPRWASFREHAPQETVTEDLSAGLACFSGNLVWPIDLFTRVGGFWNEIHHGRCEDGELGLRAVQMGIPIGFVAHANAYHLWHERNVEWVLAANERDVPMLNERHPWVEGRCTCGHQRTMHNIEDGDRSGTCKECSCSAFDQAIFEVEEDGRRFNVSCPHCEWTGNSLLIWEHLGSHAAP